MFGLTFAFPIFLIILPFVVGILIFLYIKKLRKLEPTIAFSQLTSVFSELKPTFKEKFIHLPFILRILAISLIFIALSRPQKFSSGETVNSEGIDISMLLDISGSMLAEDLKPNRLEAAKNVIGEFIAERKNDRIGLVIFSRESFTQCPLTIDYSVLLGLLRDVQSGMLEDGTAIGSAIANGVNRLKDSKSKSKVLILLTDGVNNSGEVDPITAAQIAKEFGIRIYTIGLGTRGTAPYPVQTPFGIQYQQVPVEIDEQVLSTIAGITNGKYFRATNNRKLEEIYKEIDKLERSKIDIVSYRNASEKFYIFAELALILLLFEFLLQKFYLRVNP